MIEINLIPDVKRELLRAQRARSIVISGAILTSIVAAAVVVVMLVYIYGVQSLRHYTLDQDIKSQSSELSKVEDLSKILTIQNQLATMKDLNDKKQIDSRIFNVLSAVVPPEPNSVKLSRVTIDNTASKITLEGQTRAFDSMEVFKKTLDSAVIVYTDNNEQKSVKLADSLDAGDVSYGSNANNEKVIVFTLTFAYPAELFSPKTTNPVIKLSVNGNVTDSYLGVPRSIFTEPAKKEGGQ